MALCDLGERRRPDSGGERPFWFHYDATLIDPHLGELPALAADLLEGRRRLEAGGCRYVVVLVPIKLSVLHEHCRWPPGSELAAPAMASSALPGPLAPAPALNRPHRRLPRLASRRGWHLLPRTSFRAVETISPRRSSSGGLPAQAEGDAAGDRGEGAEHDEW